jgi:cephalosporin hydroxylase
MGGMRMTTDRLALGSRLSRESLEAIQAGTMRYTYKGVPTHKDPFDLALYQLLLWELRPGTLIEIGSKFGGSALWFSDTLRTFGIDCPIHSIDINPPTATVSGVTFHKGDGRALAATLSAETMSGLSRPLLVVEDADHSAETTLSVLQFFDPWMGVGDYIVVEDGIIDDLFDADQAAVFAGGPRQAIRDFLHQRGNDYDIDTRLCDYFGVNATWNVNGYLRRAR